jgi:hypothetical protein
MGRIDAVDSIIPADSKPANRRFPPILTGRDAAFVVRRKLALAARMAELSERLDQDVAVSQALSPPRGLIVNGPSITSGTRRWRTKPGS